MEQNVHPGILIKWPPRSTNLMTFISGLLSLHTKDVIKMVPVVPLFSTEHSKGKYWLFLKN